MTTATATPTLTPTALPPGPSRPQPLVAARFMLQPTGFLEANSKRYGDFFTVTLTKGRTVVFTSDPDTVKSVFTGNPEQLLAGVGNVILQPLLGPRSVLLLDGPEHLRQRRLMLPSFHGERMRQYAEVMREIAERHVGRWPLRSAFPTQPAMQAITLEVILRAVFGVTDRTVSSNSRGRCAPSSTRPPTRRACCCSSSPAPTAARAAPGAASASCLSRPTP
jgi:cytochrome P450